MTESDIFTKYNTTGFENSTEIQNTEGWGGNLHFCQYFEPFVRPFKAFLRPFKAFKGLSTPLKALQSNRAGHLRLF